MTLHPYDHSRLALARWEAVGQQIIVWGRQVNSS